MKNLRRRRFFGFGGFGSGATLADPVPVGGVVAGWMTGAVRDAVEDEAADSGAGGALGISDVGIVLGSAAFGLDGGVVGAGLGTTVSPSFLSSA